MPLRPLRIRRHGNNKKKMKPDPRLLRAARELLRWDQPRLAEMAGVSFMTVKRVEAGDDKVRDGTRDKLQLALEKAGVIFLENASLGGIRLQEGVALALWAKPDPVPEKRIYNYGSRPGRPPKTA